MKLRIQACSDRGCRRDCNEYLLSVGGQIVRDEQMEEVSVDIPQDGTYQLLISDGMGGTPSGVIWHKGRALLINCRDSRTYRFRNGLLTLLTTDDTERGITGCPSDKKLLLSCIGGGTCTVTVEDITDRLMDEDMLVICSDGLTDEISEDEMEMILSNDYEPAIGMVERAKDNGASDNISVAVALVGEGDFAPGSADDEYDDDGRYDAWS